MKNEYLTIKEASKILGVSALTLRNWDKNGKLKGLRHPLNNYRVYKSSDLEALMDEMKSGLGYRETRKREFKKIVVKHLSDN
jgi:DNA (cytosine-5)-methyltransferase 1